MKRPGSSSVRLSILLLLSCACIGAAEERKRTPDSPIQADIPPLAPAPAEAGFWKADNLSRAIFGPANGWDAAYDRLEGWKKEYHVPITIGAQSWIHSNNQGPYSGTDYGVRGERGTYYYFVEADPSFTLDNPYVQEIGYHEEFRFRDGNKLRSYYPHAWYNWESYGYLKTPVGKIKIGQIWKRFGSDWDSGTWWGGVQYFDGFKLDPDYGISWENTWQVAHGFSLDSFVQFFVAEDGINGSLKGADTESVAGLNERNTGVVRLVPTWRPNKDTTIALGISGLLGEIEHGRQFGVDTERGAYDVDLTLKWKGFTVLAEITDAFGAANPVRYLSGGPSDRTTDWLVGASCKQGPFTLRADFSRGEDHHPYGHQSIFIPGLTVQITKNITTYFEYVLWNVTNDKGVKQKYEDGYQLAFVYSF